METQTTVYSTSEIKDARDLVGDVRRDILANHMATEDALDDGIMPDSIHAYRVVFARDGAPHVEAGQYVYFGAAARCAISWGGDSDWHDSTGDIDADLEHWLTDEDWPN